MENEVHSYSLDHTKIIENIPLPYCLLVDTLNVFSEKLPNIYVQLEPNAIYNNEDYLLENQGKYHTILTFNQKILDSCPNARKYIYGTTWMEKYMYDNVDISKKQFAISHMAGTKVWPNAPGHILRQIIHNNQEILTSYPITFYRSFHPPQLHDYGNNPILSSVHKDKVILFETYQFSIVIENSKQTNYFTEKLMDCLLMKTIPIYYGCPNISDFFDTTGWIIINTIQGENILYELDSKLYLLCQDKHYYNNHFNIIEKNHVIAQKYTDIYINLSNSV